MAKLKSYNILRFLTLSLMSCVYLLGAPATPQAYQLAGGVHDRSSDPAYIASGIPGVCFECHVAHGAYELMLWGRDLSPDAINGSDLCLDCHSGSPPSWASTAKDMSDAEESLHDFTGDSIASSGVCSSCHDLHNSDDSTASFAGSASGQYFTGYALWRRDLTDDLGQYDQKRGLDRTSTQDGPNYLVGMTAF